jgi:hypothetical protein
VPLRERAGYSDLLSRPGTPHAIPESDPKSQL